MTLDDLIHNKALIIGLFAAGAAYGGAQFQISQVRGDVADLQKDRQSTQQMREQAARIDERTKQIREEQQRQREMLEQLIRRDR